MALLRRISASSLSSSSAFFGHFTSIISLILVELRYWRTKHRTAQWDWDKRYSKLICLPLQDLCFPQKRAAKVVPGQGMPCIKSAAKALDCRSMVVDELHGTTLIHHLESRLVVFTSKSHGQVAIMAAKWGLAATWVSNSAKVEVYSKQCKHTARGVSCMFNYDVHEHLSSDNCRHFHITQPAPVTMPPAAALLSQDLGTRVQNEALEAVQWCLHAGWWSSWRATRDHKSMLQLVGLLQLGAQRPAWVMTMYKLGLYYSTWQLSKHRALNDINNLEKWSGVCGICASTEGTTNIQGQKEVGWHRPGSPQRSCMGSPLFFMGIALDSSWLCCHRLSTLLLGRSDTLLSQAWGVQLHTNCWGFVRNAYRSLSHWYNRWIWFSVRQRLTHPVHSSLSELKFYSFHVLSRTSCSGAAELQSHIWITPNNYSQFNEFPTFFITKRSMSTPSGAWPAKMQVESMSASISWREKQTSQTNQGAKQTILVKILDALNTHCKQKNYFKTFQA